MGRLGIACLRSNHFTSDRTDREVHVTMFLPGHWAFVVGVYWSPEVENKDCRPLLSLRSSHPKHINLRQLQVLQSKSKGSVIMSPQQASNNYLPAVAAPVCLGHDVSY